MVASFAHGVRGMRRLVVACLFFVVVAIVGIGVISGPVVAQDDFSPRFESDEVDSIGAGGDVTTKIIVASNITIKSRDLTGDEIYDLINNTEDFIAGLNHRFLQQQIKDAAGYGKRSNIHGYSPISSYAYGTELGQDEAGRY